MWIVINGKQGFLRLVFVQVQLSKRLETLFCLVVGYFMVFEMVGNLRYGTWC